MSKEPQSTSGPESTSDSIEHRGYEIRTRTVGPLHSGNASGHYKASVVIFHNGSKVEGSLEHLQAEFAYRELAESAAQQRGKELVNQYC